MDRTRSMKLVSESTDWLEAELIQDLLHRDLAAEGVEVDTGHNLPKACY